MERAQIAFWSAFLFLLGVLAGSTSAGFIWFAAAAAGGYFVCRLAWNLPARYAFFLVPLMLGFLYIRAEFAVRETIWHIPREAPAAAQIIGEPVKTARGGFRAEAKLLPPHRGRVMLFAETPFAYGDELRFRAGRAELARGELPFLYAEEPVISAQGKGVWLKTRLLEAKNHLIGTLKSYLPSEAAALLAGITLGERDEFSPEFREAMRASGTTHLVALSGYNIAILVAAFTSLCRGRLPRRFTFYAAALAISLFVLMTGAEASIVRAALMGGLVLLAGEAGRPYAFGHALVLVACGMVLVDPSILCFDLGFQLSFASLLGIAYLYEPFRAFLRLAPQAEDWLAWRENLLLTLSASAAVLPLLLFNFDFFPLAGIAANTLLVGVIPYTMFFGFCAMFAGNFAGYLGQLFAWIAHLLLSYEIWIIKFFGGLRLPVGNFLPGAAEIGAYYLFLLWFARRFTTKPEAWNVEHKKEAQGV